MSEAIDFNKYQRGYEDAKGSNYTLPPLGKHELVITNVEFANLKNGDGIELGVAWEYRTAQGYEFSDTTWVNPKQAWVTKRRLAVLGVTTDVLPEINAALPGVIGAKVNALVETSKDGKFTNLNFTFLITPGTGTGTPEEEPIPEEDIPF